MTEHRSERPPRLVPTCAYLGVIGAFQVLQVIIVLTGWYSESGEDQVKRFTDPLVADGIKRGDAETIYRVFLAILAILAASVLVFAIYTALGHAVSRIMLTITAPLMALLGIMQGSFMSILLSVVALAFVLQLWNAGRTPLVRAARRQRRAGAGRPLRLAAAAAAGRAPSRAAPGAAAAVGPAPPGVRPAAPRPLRTPSRSCPSSC